jgi:hypothetical protein
VLRETKEKSFCSSWGKYGLETAVDRLDIFDVREPGKKAKSWGMNLDSQSIAKHSTPPIQLETLSF